ncbi:MAG: PQQ-binding-like beta-propeller repeat protein [Candidatus Bathyarchaeia archaeon]
MNLLKNGKQSTTTLILILAFAALAAQVSTVTAAVEFDTYAFIAVAPNPIGVGEVTHVGFWLSDVPPTAFGGAGDRWQGMMLTITKPDGTTESKGPFTSDAVASAWIDYTPTMVGTYYFQFSFPGQTIMVGNVSQYYKPSVSPKTELIVQQNPIAPWPEVSAPTDYWERPINAENYGWASIGGNWLMAGYNTALRPFGGGSAFNPYTKAPNTAHIVWTKPIVTGGIVGGEYGTAAYYTGESYEQRFQPPVIINGKLYYNTADPPRYGFVCVDLRTGEEDWYMNGTSGPVSIGGGGAGFGGVTTPQITLGQIYNYNSFNQHGALPYLWSISGWGLLGVSPPIVYSMYDAFTGNWILNLANASAAQTIVSGPNGELLAYILNGAGNWLAMWNSSKAIPPPTDTGTMPANPMMFESGRFLWRPPMGQTLDWNKGIQWNVTVPDVPGAQALSRTTYNSEILLATSTVAPSAVAAGQRTIPGAVYIDVAYDAKTGKELWHQERKNVGSSPTWSTNIGDGVYAIFAKETMQWHGYDANTGNEIWVTEPYKNSWGMYYGGSYIAYGKLYVTSYEGVMHAYDVKTGKTAWDNPLGGSSGLETPYGHWVFYSGLTVADGKVYAGNGEHSPGPTLYRGSKLWAIDTNSGNTVWSIAGWFANPAVADGYLVTLNGYDNQIYCFGKGQTATTVSAPQTAVPKGTAVMITGTVTDQSPGAKGTPAIADSDMTAWMEYKYMQRPMPVNAKGVPVKLMAVAPDGTESEIGTVTSDIGGSYGMMWTPPAEGKYIITASFAGSESYGSSYATTYVGVSAAPAASATASTAATFPAEAFYALAAVTALVIVLAAVVVWKRRPA